MFHIDASASTAYILYDTLQHFGNTLVSVCVGSGWLVTFSILFFLCSTTLLAGSSAINSRRRGGGSRLFNVNFCD